MGGGGGVQTLTQKDTTETFFQISGKIEWLSIKKQVNQLSNNRQFCRCENFRLKQVVKKKKSVIRLLLFLLFLLFFLFLFFFLLLLLLLLLLRLVNNYLSNWRRVRYILPLATEVNSCFGIIILKRWANIGQKNDFN